MRVALTKISQLKSDIWSCHSNNFSLKQVSGLMGGKGESRPPRPSPWIRHWFTPISRENFQCNRELDWLHLTTSLHETECWFQHCSRFIINKSERLPSLCSFRGPVHWALTLRTYPPKGSILSESCDNFLLYIFILG